ncbi:recombinase family protein [Mycobacteroides chelonae]|uniref:recombinase family protein n=1 Tax=Mycobacteroides chelonae TaxID=1774 RepID=UPI0008A8ABE4|nr:recombinase family protein [Mycobacteroides chelonae]OHU37653.1 hypothetical protein BKG78_13490 [Mycobacteroides chelonae]
MAIKRLGIAEDLDVSAGRTTPFDRPQLGKWLTTRRGEFDVIVVYRVDRIVRRLFDLADLIRWCREHGVAFVSATESFLDLTPPFGDIIALLVAKVAEMELEAISERNASAFRHSFTKGKYRGGIPPWGPERDGSSEWRLVQDPEQVAVIREVVQRVVAGEPLRAIAHDLTKRGVLTPNDRFAQYQGRDVAGHEWHSSPLKRALTSHTLLGRVVTREQSLDAQDRPQRDAKGRKVFGDDVLVVEMTVRPLCAQSPLSLARYSTVLQSNSLDVRTERSPQPPRSSGLLLRIVYCAVCGRPGYQLKGGRGRKARYRCSSAQKADGPCTNKTIPLDYADAEVERQVLENMGSLERKRRVWFAGNDHTDELREINKTLANLADSLATTAFRRGTPQRAKLDQRIAALSERQAELSAAPNIPAGWRYEPTGETLAEWWADATDEQRNIWLRQYDFRYEWRSQSGDNGRIVVDEFKQVGELELDLDADVLLGSIAGIVTALSDPVAIAEYNALPEK